MNEPRPLDPCEWTSEHVSMFAEDATEAEVAAVLRELSKSNNAASIQVMVGFLSARNACTHLKPVPSQLAGCALLCMGAPGVDALKRALLADAMGSGPNLRYIPELFYMLWKVSEGGVPEPSLMSGRVDGEILGLAMPADTREAAAMAVREIVAESWVNADVFFLVAQFMARFATRNQFDRKGSEEGRKILAILSEGAIRLSPSLIAEFQRMVEAQLVEERYQEFLTEHPVFLDPLAAAVVPKQRLGNEYATDFAIRNHDGRWLLVEIERPQDPIFTNKRDFRERFVHAYGQVLDFQAWVDSNVAYAQKSMPDISVPRGLLIMGMRSALSQDELSKLRSFGANSSRIDVLTFDDLISRARSLYSSIWKSGA